VRPRKGSKAICSRCHESASGYDQLPERSFEFIPFWGFLVFLLYSMRRVDCRRCQAVVVEEVPSGDGKRTLTRAYMLFLARWTRRLSWKETAEAFRTSWEKVFDAVEHVVTFGLEHRVCGQIDAIGVDEIQYAKGQGARRKIESQAAIGSFRRSRKSSNRPLRRQHRNAMMLLAPSTVQCIPDRLRRVAIAPLQPASRTPDDVQKPCLWNRGYRMRWRLRKI
jgi:transposase